MSIPFPGRAASRLAAAMLLAATATGCTSFDLGRLLGQQPEAAPATSAPPPVPPAPPRARLKKPAPDATARQVPKEPQANQAAIPHATPPAIQARQIVGLNELQTANLLGRPQAEVPALPGKVWRYGADGCQLDIHLFPDVRSGGYLALDYKVSSAPGTNADECVARIARRTYSAATPPVATLAR